MNFKRLTAAAMSATMLLSAPFTAYADEVGGAQKEIESGSLVDNKTTVSVPVTATINSSFTVSLPSKMELTKDEHASSYSYSGLVGVKGDIDADAVVKVKPDAKVTMYDVTYRPSEVETTPSSEEEQSYVHKDPTDVASSQPVTTWLQSELSSETAGSGYSMSGEYHSTDFGLSVASLSSGKWEGVLNFNINYENTYVAPGIYNESGELTTSWADLVSEGAITVENGVLTSGYSADTGTNTSAAGLTELVVADDVTSLGDDAFRACTNLTSVTLSGSVTEIGDNAFNGCSSLSAITMTENIETVGDNAFEGTPWLTAKQTENPLVVVNGILVDASTATGAVTIPESVTEISAGSFAGNSNVTKVIVPDSVTVIGENAFDGIAKVVYNGTATGSPWGATQVCETDVVALTVGETYTMGEYSWVCTETDGDLAVMQSTGVTSGAWPGYKMTKFGNGSNYARNIDGQDISAYDNKTTTLYNSIKSAEYTGASYGQGLFLVSKEKAGNTTGTQGSGNYYTTLKAAAANGGSFGASFGNAWLGTVDGGSYIGGGGYAWSVSMNGIVSGGINQNDLIVVAPAFNLDTSKITLSGNTITVNAE